jgi:class 3 adenylate cyclase
MMRKFFDLVLGCTDEKDVADRQYNIAVCGILSACVFYGVMNHFAGIGLLQTLIPLVYSLFLLPIYIANRFWGKRFPFVFCLSFMAFYYVSWFFNGGGSSGSLQVFFSVVLLAGVYFLDSWHRWFFAIVQILVMICLMAYEYLDGRYIFQYPSLEVRVTDVLICTISGALITVAIVLSVHKEVDKAKKKQRELLAVILPERVIGELISMGSVMPRRYNDVSVLFCDIVNFTSASIDLDPELLIGRLNRLYTEYDKIIEDECCERIKTIGDSYLAVANMNILNQDGLASLCRCAMRFLAITESLRDSTQSAWKIRIGIHVGEVVGAVVGTTKYLYDVFGDTVNYASRLEMCSEPMRINTSEDVKDRLASRFDFHDRGPISVKGRGECNMYFLVSGPGVALAQSL